MQSRPKNSSRYPKVSAQIQYQQRKISRLLMLRIASEIIVKMQIQIKQSLLIAFSIFLASLTMQVTAETAYVSDELEITLRTGPAVKNKITKMLKSGAPLEVLQENSNGYTEVKTSDGKTGWVLKRYLMVVPSARSRLVELQQREQGLAAQQQEVESLRIAAIKNEKSSEEMQANNAQLRTELEKVKNIAADTLTINEKNKALAVALAQAEEKQTVLQVENERLKNNTEQAWFLRGAGVILLGMFLGLLIPKLRFKKKRKWGEVSNY
ncbi:MAG: TIGR04211 family SH3 domain-containing protein [Chloroflexota bacterium]|nr:MAG: TIGR04211 family SH3 domain-containing protein [Chloroflexota bacterium]